MSWTSLSDALTLFGFRCPFGSYYSCPISACSTLWKFGWQNSTTTPYIQFASFLPSFCSFSVNFTDLGECVRYTVWDIRFAVAFHRER